jgi:Tfp pilus assembly protein PilO
MSARGWLGGATLWVMVFAGVLLAWWVTVQARSVAARDALAKDVLGLQQRVRELEVVANRLEEFKTERARVEARRAEIERTLPRAMDERVVAVAFDRRARELNLIVASLRWGARTQRELLVAAPVTVEVRGDPAAGLLFAAGVARGDPLVEVRSIELKSGTPSVLKLEGEALSLPDAQ